MEFGRHVVLRGQWLYCCAGSIPATGIFSLWWYIFFIMLIVNNVSCVRNNIRLFRNINFKVRSGFVLQIVAANGVGKTSLLRILCGLLSKDSGSVAVSNTFNKADFIVENSSLHTNKIYIGNKQSLYKNLTSYANLEFYLSLLNTSKTQEFTIIGALNFFNISILKNCADLSTGQCQRVTLARLLLTKADIWYLDEPFLYLDLQGVTAVNNLILDFIKLGNNIVIITTHAIITELLCKSVIVYL